MLVGVGVGAGVPVGDGVGVGCGVLVGVDVGVAVGRGVLVGVGVGFTEPLVQTKPLQFPNLPSTWPVPPCSGWTETHGLPWGGT